MRKFNKLLKDVAKDAKKKCAHQWITDKQGRYCEKCGNREYKFKEV